jgi:hypothetical protein
MKFISGALDSLAEQPAGQKNGLQILDRFASLREKKMQKKQQHDSKLMCETGRATLAIFGEGCGNHRRAFPVT